MGNHASPAARRKMHLACCRSHRSPQNFRFRPRSQSAATAEASRRCVLATQWDQPGVRSPFSGSVQLASLMGRLCDARHMCHVALHLLVRGSGMMCIYGHAGARMATFRSGLLVRRLPLAAWALRLEWSPRGSSSRVMRRTCCLALGGPPSQIKRMPLLPIQPLPSNGWALCPNVYNVLGCLKGFLGSCGA